MQERHNSIANALELRLSCTNPSISFLMSTHLLCDIKLSHVIIVSSLFEFLVNQICIESGTLTDILKYHNNNRVRKIGIMNDTLVVVFLRNYGTIIKLSIFFQILTKIQPIAQPWELGMGCLLWVQHLIKCCPSCCSAVYNIYNISIWYVGSHYSGMQMYFFRTA